MDIAKVLLEAKADTNQKDNLGNTPLHHAALSKKYELCASLILGGANAGIL